MLWKHLEDYVSMALRMATDFYNRRVKLNVGVDQVVDKFRMSQKNYRIPIIMDNNELVWLLQYKQSRWLMQNRSKY